MSLYFKYFARFLFVGAALPLMTAGFVVAVLVRAYHAGDRALDDLMDYLA